MDIIENDIHIKAHKILVNVFVIPRHPLHAVVGVGLVHAVIADC